LSFILVYKTFKTRKSILSKNKINKFRQFAIFSKNSSCAGMAIFSISKNQFRPIFFINWLKINKNIPEKIRVALVATKSH